QRTNKTYIQFLNDIRIENACKLLLKYNDMSIEEIATVSGYSSIANFNRKFKKIKNMTPTAFRKLSINH
ncbi:MAG: helix-turn-helix domain-containing protein, partial [Flavobacteriaceae bacterium]|nr:helix-turn-helix domain-containing protein [Flavobacteriaceae bacterium]